MENLLTQQSVKSFLEEGIRESMPFYFCALRTHLETLGLEKEQAEDVLHNLFYQEPNTELILELQKMLCTEFDQRGVFNEAFTFFLEMTGDLSEAFLTMLHQLEILILCNKSYDEGVRYLQAFVKTCEPIFADIVPKILKGEELAYATATTSACESIPELSKIAFDELNGHLAKQGRWREWQRRA